MFNPAHHWLLNATRQALPEAEAKNERRL